MRETIAAEHAPGGLPWWVWLCLFLIVLALGYVAGCRWRPFAPCRCCKGTAKHFRSDGKVFRDCWWCRKTPGRRLRIGRRIWNRFARIRKAGT